MKVEFTLNVDKDKESKMKEWLSMFSKILLMGEDETLVDAKVDGEDIALY